MKIRKTFLILLAVVVMSALAVTFLPQKSPQAEAATSQPVPISLDLATTLSIVVTPYSFSISSLAVGAEDATNHSTIVVTSNDPVGFHIDAKMRDITDTAGTLCVSAGTGALATDTGATANSFTIQGLAMGTEYNGATLTLVDDDSTDCGTISAFTHTSEDDYTITCDLDDSATGGTELTGTLVAALPDTIDFEAIVVGTGAGIAAAEVLTLASGVDDGCHASDPDFDPDDGSGHMYWQIELLDTHANTTIEGLTNYASAIDETSGSPAKFGAVDVEIFEAADQPTTGTYDTAYLQHQIYADETVPQKTYEGDIYFIITSGL